MAEAEAAVAIVHARAGDSILLMRRAEREGDPWSGHWSFPGGRHGRGDAGLEQTALRELAEECGIRLKPEDLEAALPLTIARRRTGPFLRVAPFLFRVERELAAVPDPREAVEARWVPLSVLMDPAQHGLRPVPGLPPEMRFPAIELNGVPLWGFTYRLIADWLGLSPKERPLEQAGFQAANRMLEFLLSRGLALRQGWERGAQGILSASVSGPIPAAEVLAEFSLPGCHVPAVNCVEARADSIRVVGPAFEEYLIYGRA